MNITLIQIIWTVFAFVFFIAIVIWAYSGARKKDFDAAAQLPFDEVDIVDNENKKQE